MDYFIPRNNKFFAFFITRPRFIWYVCTVSATMLLCGIWWSLLYRPLQMRIASAQIKCAQLGEQQVELVRYAHEINDLEQQVSDLRHTFAQCTTVPNGYKCLLNLLLIKGVEANLKLLSCLPQPPIAHSWYVEHPVELEFLGGFPEIVEYLQLIGGTDYLLFPRTIALRKNMQHEQQQPSDEHPLHLVVKFDLIEVCHKNASADRLAGLVDNRLGATDAGQQQSIV